MQDYEMALRLARLVSEAGGCAYFVGGYVRDQILKKGNKDLDLEIHGISEEKLVQILDSLGERMEIGKSFGIYTLRGYHLDIALPRKERAVGAGHRDFEVQVDPALDLKEASRRRDFTMNAMMQEVLTGKILDPWDGKTDLSKRRIRHVSDQTFVEDPLRVLRMAQFAARFEFEVCPETEQLCRKMNLTVLPRERVWEELKKALLKSARPSLFFEELRRVDQLSDWFPEVQALIGVPQNPKWHPEGDAWNHTMNVLNAAASLRAEAEDPLALMMAALCHDLGKSVTTRTEKGKIISYGHEGAGIPLTDALLERLCGEIQLTRSVENLVLLHMRPNFLAAQHSSMKSTCHLFDEAKCPEDLLLLAKADRMGQDREEDYTEQEDFLKKRLAVFRERMRMPAVNGKDLIGLGARPGPEIGELLAFAHKLQLAGISREQILKEVKARISSGNSAAENLKPSEQGKSDLS